MACAPTGTRRAPCAAVGNCGASPPSHPHAAHTVWCRGGKRSRASTAPTVRTVAPGHAYGSHCLRCLRPLQAEGRLWRCQSATRHEPSGCAKAAAAETATGPPGALWGTCVSAGSEAPDVRSNGPAYPSLGAHRGDSLLFSRLCASRCPRLWLLSLSAPRAPIPIKTRYPVVPQLSATAFYPSWRTTMDKTLCVGRHNLRKEEPTGLLEPRKGGCHDQQ